MENMKNERQDWNESDAKARELVIEALVQLEAAKKSVETLRLDGMKGVEAYNTIAFELERSRAQVSSLVKRVNKLDAELSHVSNKFEAEYGRDRQNPSTFEIEQLKSALEAAEIKLEEERIMNMVRIANAYDFIEQIQSEREPKEVKLQTELTELKEVVSVLKSRLSDKEIEVKHILHENVILKLEMSKLEWDPNDVVTRLEMTRDAGKERELALEVVEKSNMRAGRVTEQLEDFGVGNSEIEIELKRVKVQAEQWRKAAETAVSMLLTGKNKDMLVEQTESLSRNCELGVEKTCSSCSEEDTNSEIARKKNANILTKIGSLWKKLNK